MAAIESVGWKTAQRFPRVSIAWWDKLRLQWKRLRRFPHYCPVIRCR